MINDKLSINTFNRKKCSLSSFTQKFFRLQYFKAAVVQELTPHQANWVPVLHFGLKGEGDISEIEIRVQRGSC